jgi:hypothetical protein
VRGQRFLTPELEIAMAELELSIRYNTLAHRIGFVVMCVLFPVWALIVPIMLGLFVTCVALTTTHVPVLPAILLVAALFSAFMLGLVLTATAEDDRMFISKAGFAFPPLFIPANRFRRSRVWTELIGADLIPGTNHKDRLILRFNLDHTMKVNLSDIDPKQVEQILLAIELWGTSCTRSPELITYQNELQNQNRGLGQFSQTQMWEEELSRRFSATSFIPLEPKHKLRNGKLEIVRQLAFGGLSAIYLAQENKLDFVVVKEAVIPPGADATARRNAEQRLDKEAHLLMQLRHPHIARVLDHFVEDSRHYLLLEYVNGQDLRQFVKQNGPQSEEAVRSWAHIVASIVDYLHTQDPPIIHRDLSPDNLVLRNDGELKLIDFGAANQFVGAATGTLVGKQAYIAPEQLRGKAEPQSDLYALAGTLFFLITGRDPVPLSVSHPKSVLPEISSDFDELIAYSSAFEISDRIPSARAFLDRLDSMGSTSPNQLTSKSP